MKRALLPFLVCVAGALAGCDDDPAAGVADGGPDAARNVPAVDAPAGDAAKDSGGADPAARGAYLVGSVLGCGGCHTSREMGAKPLAGVTCFRDTMPTVAGKGCINTPNLTNHDTGLRSYNDDQIKELIRKGLRPDGKYLFSAMPTHLFANLTDADVSAIVAYLRTVPGVETTLPANEEPWQDAMRPSSPILVPIKLDEANAIPQVPSGAANAESAGRGRYLAALTCIECHTKPLADPNATHSFDVSVAYAGGRSFTSGATMVYSVNLTPDQTGTKGWSPADIVKVLKMSLDRDGNRVCAPMRSYASMTDGDATDIANYLLALPAKANAIPMQCSMPATDGGTSDSGSPEAGATDASATDSGAGPDAAPTD